MVIALPPIPRSPLSTSSTTPKGDLAHVLAFDRDHCVDQLADDLTLLFIAEHALDDANLNEWHRISPFMRVSVGAAARSSNLLVASTRTQ